MNKKLALAICCLMLIGCDVNTDKDAKLCLEQANQLRESGSFDEAIALYDKAAKLPAGDALRSNIYNERGVAFGITRKWDAAIADFNKAIEVNKDNFLAYHNRGLAKMEFRDPGALDDFEKSIKLNPKYPNSYLAKAGLCEKAGRKEEAIKAYEDFITYAPQEGGPSVNWARDRIKNLSE